MRTVRDFAGEYGLALSDQQCAAVASIDAPTLLLAVPGSGKTTVLVTRLGYMILEAGIDPAYILTITYTVAATGDMRARFAGMFGDQLASRLEFRTINGICSKIIAYAGQQMGRSPYELLTDETVRMRLLTEIYTTYVKQYPTENDLKQIATMITYAKNMMLSKEEICALGADEDIPFESIFQAYEATMRKQSLMDYDDQMVYAYNMLRRMPALLEHFQRQYRYLCVDEAQDTSRIQHEIIKLLVGNDGHLFMVGDEDQSIYGFRAAYPEALLSFSKDHPGAQVLLMEDNYRSNAHIVEAANRFIQKNELRYKKQIRATKPAASEIVMQRITTRLEQYTFLEKVAEEMYHSHTEKTTAVLYRDNQSVIPLVDLLERKGIPFRIRSGDLTFFSHRVVTDVEQIIAFAANQFDTELFMKVYYKIGTYLNKQAALQACERSRRSGMSVLDAAATMSATAPGVCKRLIYLKDELTLLLRESAAEGFSRLQYNLGYRDYLDRAQISAEKLDILKALAKESNSLLGLVRRLKELDELLRNRENDPACPFILSTIHASKGLEYDRVYLMDAIDGVFPNREYDKNDDAEKKLMEEERRMFYVGVTRAREELICFYIPGKNTYMREMLPNQSGNGYNSPGGYHASGGYNSSGGYSASDNRPGVSQNRINKHRISHEAHEEMLRELMESGILNHARYGEGRVISYDEKKDALTVRFDERQAIFKLTYLMEHDLIKN